MRGHGELSRNPRRPARLGCARAVDRRHGARRLVTGLDMNGRRICGSSTHQCWGRDDKGSPCDAHALISDCDSWPGGAAALGRLGGDGLNQWGGRRNGRAVARLPASPSWTERECRIVSLLAEATHADLSGKATSRNYCALGVSTKLPALTCMVGIRKQ